MNLYRVRCRGMRDSHGTAYVVATDPTAAYLRLFHELNRRNLGFTDDRALDCVELLAGAAPYPLNGVALYLPLSAATDSEGRG